MNKVFGLYIFSIFNKETPYCVKLIISYFLADLFWY